MRFLFVGLASLALMAIAACSTPAKVDTTNAVKSVYVVSTTYNTLLTVAVAYNNLPRCEQPKAPTLCSKTAVVAQLRKANVAASASLDAAESAVKTLGSNPTVVAAAVVSAQNALDAFKVVITTYNVGG